jgi:hypothetical protein
MVPFVAILFWAVIVRIQEYGLTEFRILLTYLALWLGITTIYTLFFKRFDLKIVPLSLIVGILLSLFGPTSVFSLAVSDQSKQLVALVKGWQSTNNLDLTDREKLRVKDLSKYLHERGALYKVNELMQSTLPKKAQLNTANDTLLLKQLGINKLDIDMYSDSITKDKYSSGRTIDKSLRTDIQTPIAARKPVRMIKQFDFNNYIEEKSGTFNKMQFSFENERYLVIKENQKTNLKLDLFYIFYETDKSNLGQDDKLPQNKLTFLLSDNKGEIAITYLSGSLSPHNTLSIDGIKFTYLEYAKQ